MPLNANTLTPLQEVLEDFDRRLNTMNAADQELNLKVRQLDQDTKSLSALIMSLTNRVSLLEAPSAPPSNVVPLPTPPPTPTLVTTPPPTPTPAPVVELIQPDTRYSNIITPRTGDYWTRITTNDTMIDLGGQSHPLLVIEIAPGLRNVGVRNGSIKRIEGMRTSADQSNLSKVLLSNLNITNPDGSAMTLHGSNITIERVHASALDYCLYLGGTSTENTTRLTDCSFSSQGPQSTCRFTSIVGLIVKESTFINTRTHALRIHGDSSLVTINGVRLMGSGNGLSIGSMGPQVPGNVRDVKIMNTIIDVAGPDRLNLDRQGGLRSLHLESLKVRSPSNWNLVAEYKNQHPSDWIVTGLEELT